MSQSLLLRNKRNHFVNQLLAIIHHNPLTLTRRIRIAPLPTFFTLRLPTPHHLKSDRAGEATDAADEVLFVASRGQCRRVGL